MVEDFPELEFIGGGEESFGFMVGDFVRHMRLDELIMQQFADRKRSTRFPLDVYQDRSEYSVEISRDHID